MCVIFKDINGYTISGDSRETDRSGKTRKLYPSIRATPSGSYHTMHGLPSYLKGLEI